MFSVMYIICTDLKRNLLTLRGVWGKWVKEINSFNCIYGVLGREPHYEFDTDLQFEGHEYV